MERLRAVRRGFVAIVVVPALVAFAPCDAADFVTAVSSKNPMTTLSREQIADIFLGRTAQFPDGRPAVAVDQLEGSSVRDEFYREIAGKSPAQMKAYWSKIIFTGRGQPPKEVSGNSEMRKRLAENPNMIGYIETAAVDASVKVVSP